MMNVQSMSPSTRRRWMASRTKHGGYLGGKESPDHYIWRSMIIRAGKHKHYKHVSVCKRWYTFENFIADMGFRPSPKHTLDRYPDPFGNYEPGNCRWATYSQQMKNKRLTPHFVQNGRIGTVSDWANILGISTPLARYRWTSWGTFRKGAVWLCVPPKDLKKWRLKNISIA